MTETSPLASIAHPPPRALGEDAWGYRSSQGRPMPFVELRIVGDKTEEPWDGRSSSEIQVRGPWIARRYFNNPSGDDRFADGWLKTDDSRQSVATATCASSIAPRT